MESVYTFFSYDVTTYVAGNLEIYEEDEEENENVYHSKENGAKMDEGREGGEREGGEGEGEKDEGERAEGKSIGEGGDDNKERGDNDESRERHKEDDASEVGDTRNDEMGVEGMDELKGAEGEVIDDDEETDDALSGVGYDDTSTEEDAFEDSKSPEDRNKMDASSYSNEHHHLTSGKNHQFKTSSATSNSLGSLQTVDTQSQSTTSTNKMSSFTVENILMGSTSRSNSTSSGSPTSAQHSSSATFLPFSYSHGSSSSTTNSTPASPASNNWMSHPPVKYTKYTMMSPSSMRSGGDKRKRAERDKSVSTSSHDRLQVSSGTLIEEGRDQPAVKSKEEPQSLVPSSLSGQTVSTSQSHHIPSLTYHHSVIQTAIPVPAVPLSRQSSAQSITAASPRLIPVSPNTITSFPRAQTHSPHQQQQYVVFFPPNVALMTAPTSDLQVIGQPTSSQLYVQSALQKTQNHIHKSRTIHPTTHHNSLTSSKSSSVATLSANNPRFTRTSSTPSHHTHSNSTHIISDPRYHPIAPRTDSTQTETRKSATKAPTSGDKTQAKPKQKKLRFHMTTVVKKVRKRSPSLSMTAPPPSICDRTSSDTKQCEHDSSSHQNDSTTTKLNKSDTKLNNTTMTTTTTTTTAVLENHTSTESAHNTSNTFTSSPNTTTRSLSSSAIETISKASSLPQTSNLSDTDRQTNFEKMEEQYIASPSLPLTTTKDTLTASSSPPPRGFSGRGKGRGRGRRTRGYTRRKRELTFHLYEDPYRAKRSRQQN